MKILNIILQISLLFLFFGCAKESTKVSELLQSKGASAVYKDYKHITDLLTLLKQKLDARNPNQFGKQRDFYIYQEIKNKTNAIHLLHNEKYIQGYDNYLKIAFEKKASIQNRNDFLIMGIHKLISDTYKIEDGHKFTTLGFDGEKFKKLYYYLKVLNWKLKTDRDENGRYLFLTWQKNWQIELEAKNATTFKNLNELKAIKEGKESIFEASNFNFEVIMNQMMFHVKNSSGIIGDEPLDLSLDVLKSFVLFL